MGPALWAYPSGSLEGAAHGAISSEGRGQGHAQRAWLSASNNEKTCVADLAECVSGQGCSAVHRGHAAKPHHHRWPQWLELLCRCFQKGNQDGDQQDVVAQVWIQLGLGCCGLSR